MAALNQPYTGDMHGVRGADYECYRQSRRANFRGTFRAFLASRVQNLDSIVRHKDSDLPIVNIKVLLIFCIFQNISHFIFLNSILNKIDRILFQRNEENVQCVQN